MYENQAYIGKIILIESIPEADFIESVIVVCGKGGKWRGTVLKDQFKCGDLCTVFLPDSILPQRPEYLFMQKHKYRVKMCRFKGVPSEVLIMSMQCSGQLGDDVTYILNVSKYVKPIPVNLAGDILDNFPSFIPKTDEPNWQSSPELFQSMMGKRCYVTLKMDGSSTTAYKYNGHFGVCSRNLELKEDENNGYWKLANKYNLREELAEGYAIQFETCGPKINKNALKLTELHAYGFYVYNINERRYLNFLETCEFFVTLKFPMTHIYRNCFYFDDLFYHNPDQILFDQFGFSESRKNYEGFVIRQYNEEDYQKKSFKVLNLEYKNQ